MIYASQRAVHIWWHTQISASSEFPFGRLSSPSCTTHPHFRFHFHLHLHSAPVLLDVGGDGGGGGGGVVLASPTPYSLLLLLSRSRYSLSISLTKSALSSVYTHQKVKRKPRKRWCMLVYSPPGAYFSMGMCLMRVFTRPFSRFMIKQPTSIFQKKHTRTHAQPTIY